MGSTESASLSGVRILVTRPKDQQQELIDLISAAGGEAISFPTLEIGPTSDRDSLKHRLHELQRFDIAIFVSPNAARYVFEALREESLTLPESLLLACVGKGCSKTVQDNGYKVQAIPVDGIGSEGLLQHRIMQDVSGKHIIIFRGNGGRELLAQALTERGARVEYAECYERGLPDTDSAPLIQDWKKKAVHLVTITSTQALKNLWQMLGDDAVSLIPATPMIVISERIAQTAIDMGCSRNTVKITDDTSDAAIVATIKQWRLQQKAI
jgi:uroporphyrinogen-III synthase